MSLLSVIKKTMAPQETPGATGGLTAQHTIWLLDSFSSLFESRACWGPAADLPTTKFLEFSLAVSALPDAWYDFNVHLSEKVYAHLVLLCAEVAKSPWDILGDEEEKTSACRLLSGAFVQLGRASMRYGPISRLVKGHLAAPLRDLVADNSALGIGTDFWVGYRFTSNSQNSWS